MLMILPFVQISCKKSVLLNGLVDNCNVIIKNDYCAANTSCLNSNKTFLQPNTKWNEYLY